MTPGGFQGLLRDEVVRAGVEIPDPAMRKLVTYCEELERWNKKLNLTSLEGRNLVRRLVVEPCWIAQQLQVAGVMWDIGSGNGSPAIPMGLSANLESLHLIEVRAKRAAFLRHVTAALEMRRAHVHRARFEEIAVELASPDWITMQAVEPAEPILSAIRAAGSSNGNIVWITSRRKASSVRASSVLEIPESETVAILLALDHS